MKEIWVKADPWKKELVTTALEAGADAVIVHGRRGKNHPTEPPEKSYCKNR